jgi:tungstate transport system ATP-binding protein
MSKNIVSSIVLRGIYKRYDTGGFDLSVDYLEFRNRGIHIIAGSNGSGKSTLLKLIALIDRPSEGSILFNGLDIPRYDSDDRVLRRRIGLLMQNPYLFNINVFDNIALGLRIRRYKRSEIIFRVNSMMAALNISHLARRRVNGLSRGEYQKAAIGQILVLEPDIVLMDEPVANIDQESTLSIEETVKTIQKRTNSIVIMTTHSLDQACRVSKDLISIKDGRITSSIGGEDAGIRRSASRYIEQSKTIGY